MIKLISWSCFALLMIPVLALCIFLPIGYMAVGSAIPGLVIYWCFLLIAQIASLFLYFRFPWIAAVIGWIDMAVILCGVVPWKGHTAHSFLQQFGFDLLFFIAAQMGFVTWKIGRHRNAQSA